MTCLDGLVVVVLVWGGGVVGTNDVSNWQLTPTAKTNRKENFNIFSSDCRDETL
jgi:hypothetical protein